MSTTTPESAPAVLVPVAKPLFTVVERQALAAGWCALHGLHLFSAKRIDIESFPR